MVSALNTAHIILVSSVTGFEDFPECLRGGEQVLWDASDLWGDPRSSDNH